VKLEADKFKVNERDFDDAMRKLIATPASAKDGIKPTTVHKKTEGRSKVRDRRP
jgi:hypothetical protein